MKHTISVISIALVVLGLFTTTTYAGSCSPIDSSNYTACCTGIDVNTTIGQSCTAYFTTSVAPKSAAPQLPANAPASAYQPFTPNVNLSSGNSYGGITLSGVGGAIASCTNVGSFLVKGASDLLGKTKTGKQLKALYESDNKDTPVSVSDKASQDKLDTINNTSQCLDGIAYAVAKNTLAQVTNKTLRWVNTGLNGNPLYVQNVPSYLGSIKNQQLSSFLGTVQNTDPIFGNALRSAITQQVTGQSDGKIDTPLNTPESRAYTSFMGDFTSGGWDAFLNPANNPIGSYLNAVGNAGTAIQTEQQNAQNEIQRNNGFLDMKTCAEYNTPPSTGATPTCKTYQTVTPGSVISAQVASITTSPTRQLEYANKINEVLGSFFDSFVNNLLSKGLRGSSNGGSRITNGSSFISEGNNSVPDNTSAGALGYQASGSGASGDFDITRPQQLRAIVQTQYNFLNRVQDSQIALARVIPSIGALDYCIPGPNPGWQSGLDNNWGAFINSIQQADPKQPSTVEKLVNNIPGIGSLLGSVIGIFTGSGDTPPIWTMQTTLNDKVTGGDIGMTRVFWIPDHHQGPNTSDVMSGLNVTYGIVNQMYQYYGQNINFADQNSAVGNAFRQAAANDQDPGYIDGYLQDTYTQTASLVGYNQAATTIDQQYDQDTTDTKNALRQLELIRTEVNSIVAGAKSRYIAQRAAAGDPVDMQCINQAYVIDNSAIVPVVRQEPDTQDPMVQHSIESANYFYTTQAI